MVTKSSSSASTLTHAEERYKMDMNWLKAIEQNPLQCQRNVPKAQEAVAA
jgi:hypothetical protein